MESDNEPKIFSPYEWSYDTPLESPKESSSPFTVEERVIEINTMPFQKRSDCNYKFDYYKLMDKIERVRVYTPEERKLRPEHNELNYYRTFLLEDLWFFVYFAMKNPLANHPFIVEACREVEDGVGDSVHLWARDHLKTTIISVGRVCQKILNNSELRVGIFSATRPLAVKIQSMIKQLFESSFLKRSFPDVLYEDPRRDAEKWSEATEGGLIVKRKGIYKEPTVSSWGLIEGMPTGYHLTDIICDDIINQDLQAPEVMQRICDNFDMIDNLGTRDRSLTVVGTHYNHQDPLMYIRNKTDVVTGQKLFRVSLKTATVDGTFAGRSAFSPEAVLARKRSNPYLFYCQQLLDPTPRGKERLNRDHLIEVSKKDLPINLYKFMIIDGAGDVGRRKDRRADDWAMVVLGVEPFRDDTGMSRVYIIDMVIEDMDLVTAQKEIVDMYSRNGRILKLGIEKVGMSTTEMHVCAALRARNKYVSEEMGNLVVLKPGGRSKEYRIESAVAPALRAGKIHVLNSIPRGYIERLKMEMEKFPAWRDDGLDVLSYGYDIVKSYRFGDLPADEAMQKKKKEDPYDAAFRRARERTKSGWMRV